MTQANNQTAGDTNRLAPELDGVVGKDAEGRVTVTFERHYPHSTDHVWQAITDPKQVRNWLGRLEFEPKIGGKLSMILDGSDPNGTVTTGEVLVYSPQRVLEYWIHAQDMEVIRSDYHINRWELFDRQGGCTLQFTHTFAPGERARNSVLCGWHAMLEKVDDTIAGRVTDWEHYTRDRLVELYWHYRNKPLPSQR